MTIPSGPVPRFTRGRQLAEGSDLDKLSLMIGGSGVPLTAHAGGGKALATPITSTNAIVGTVATAADSVILPQGYAGLRVFVINDGAAAMQVFGAGTDTINDVATATGVSHAQNLAALYVCVSAVPGGAARWFRLLSA